MPRLPDNTHTRQSARAKAIDFTEHDLRRLYELAHFFSSLRENLDQSGDMKDCQFAGILQPTTGMLCGFAEELQQRFEIPSSLVHEKGGVQ